MHTSVASVQDYGPRDTWPESVVYVGMPGNAARAFGIADDMAGPFGKPWKLLNDPRGWLPAYREYLQNRLENDSEFARAVANLHGKTLLCWCTRKREQRKTFVECHADTLAQTVEWLNGCSQTKGDPDPMPQLNFDLEAPIVAPKVKYPFVKNRELAVILCGDREWSDFDMIGQVLNALARQRNMSVLIEGDARGADKCAHVWAKAASRFLGISHECHPALWALQGKAAGPLRNQRMLDSLLAKADTHNLLVIAAHDDLYGSKGTTDMVNRALKAGVKVELITH